MKTLVDKGYVYRSGNPPMFYLSEQGLAVAKILAEAEGLRQNDASAPANGANGTSTTPQLADEAQQISSGQEDPSRPAAPLDASISPSLLGSQSATNTAENSNCGPERLYLPPRKHYLEHHERRAWKRTASNQSGLSIEDGIDVDLEPTRNVVVDLVQSSQEDVYVASEHDTQARPSQPVRISISLIDSSPIIQDASRSSPMVISSPLSSRVQRPLPPSSSPCEQPLLDPPSTPYRPRAHLGCHVLPANSYTIHMVMDHREVRARHAHTAEAGRRVTFEDAMLRREIHCELRALELGDILWVARPKPGNSPNIAQQWGLIQEVVLDAIVERKRLDDLTSSIFDGRWHEQKVCRTLT